MDTLVSGSGIGTGPGTRIVKVWHMILCFSGVIGFIGVIWGVFFGVLQVIELVVLKLKSQWFVVL